MNIQGVPSAASSPQAATLQAAKAATTKVDRDGDYDNSTPIKDAIEATKPSALSANGIGRNVNAAA